MPEIVCVLTNEAIEGMGKSGRTTTNVERCVKELDNSSLLLPFQCFYAAEIGNSSFVEGTLQHIFSDKRIRINREFFLASMQTRSEKPFNELSVKDVGPEVDVFVDRPSVQALQKSRRYRRTKMNNHEYGKIDG